METINTPYDDAFRTLLQDCPELVIPLINELFGTDYTGQEAVLSSANEIFIRNPNGKKEKRVTDSNMTLISLMEIRMWEYDTQIALLNAEYREGMLYVDFPDSAVIYLRSNPNTPDELKICIRAARKELKYGIPILKVRNYTLEDIFERRLWMLIPFYIFRYEKELSQIDSDEERLEKLRREYERVAEMLDQECKNGRMRSVTGGALC